MTLFFIVIIVLITILIKVNLKKQSENLNKVIDGFLQDIQNSKKMSYEEIIKQKERCDNICTMLGGDSGVDE